MRVALGHDYLTQRGGAERVVQVMAHAYPDAPVYTTLYDPDGTFPEVGSLDVRPSRLNGISALRRHHRLAMPVLAPVVSRMKIDAEVLLVSSSGWAHGMQSTGRKIVYCHAPARWLYQRDRYLGAPEKQASGLGAHLRRDLAAGALAVLGSGLRRWDREAAHSADRYLVNSTVVREAVRTAYGIEADVLPPPPALLPAGEESPVAGIEPGFVLCVARLLPYKNVDVVLAAVEQVPGVRLVVVGEGPERAALTDRAARSGRVHIAGRVTDAELRWLYRSCAALATASYEDYGLAPLEAAAFGRPACTLRDGGFLDTVVDGRTGVFFDRPEPDSVAAGLERLLASVWDADMIRDHARSFSAERFIGRIRDVVGQEHALSG
ncbi:glycosyltransferase [Luteipulveratus flavus]|uniref:D-inositol 3-phosphate glycosyltransferase n=1 Tax=Luteipulveratus flavus TaxID=3031728 RepID=A0ABT6CDB0_9MICO|nr:glycosyltransferase [Luteipulveratus sp. YIM 133296]MDF8266503.1 glycosyltransferase [Luteipulveratus sp. YIM 133296]